MRRQIFLIKIIAPSFNNSELTKNRRLKKFFYGQDRVYTLQVLATLFIKFVFLTIMASLFHKFIEVSASKPPQAYKFVQFAYMEQEIRKSYKQLKNIKGVEKPNDDFLDYWKEVGIIGREEQVTVYFRWIELLERSLTTFIQRQLLHKESDLYIKKSMISKWEVRKIKLNGLVLQIFSKRLREYPLKCFCIRKSKNKEHFSWVMEVVMQLDDSKFKTFHIGSNNINEYQQWYRQIESRIDMAKIQYFKEAIDSQNKLLLINKNSKNKVNKNQNRASQFKPTRIKTLTELVIDKQLKKIDEDDGLTIIEDDENEFKYKQAEMHPNIFFRVFPDKKLDDFCQTPLNGQLLECEKQYRLYETHGTIKIFVTLNRRVDVVFRAISESHKNWNPQIDTFNIKNKISSENSIFAYQKDKSKGFLYRQRDYFFLKHCFSLASENKKQKLFVIQKSIDSIHSPPFMTVARGEKQLIWCVVGSQKQKQSLLIVEGLIKGGGYMGVGEDKENTIKYFKKLLMLDNYLKEIELTKPSKDCYIFKSNWMVSFKQEDLGQFNDTQQQQDEFFSPKEIKSDQFQYNQPEKLIKQQLRRKSLATEVLKQETVFMTPRKDDEFNQFMKQTENNNEKRGEEMMSEQAVILSESFIMEYKPPQFNSDKSVILPNLYLGRKHRVQPNIKGKPLFAEKFRGHHLWRGQWAKAESGGLNYVDQEKMRQQRGVLTFIIKRIGKNILTGKGILNISLPVDIFCRQSNIERQAMSFGYCPVFLQKVVQAGPIDQLKAILCAVLGSSLIYLTMEKPFNPILGQTYQCWIDGCPVYFEQICHHPPIASYLMKGRGYELYGSMQAKMDLSINSGTGVNEGIFTVKFDSGRTFHFTTPPGELVGLTYGQRKLCLVDKTYFWSIEEGLFLELTYNPLSKQSRFFGGGKNFVGDERLADYFEGTLKKYRPQDLKEHFAPKKNSTRKLMLIPKSAPLQEPIAEYEKIHGRWTKQVFYGQESIFDIDNTVHLKYHDQKYPLPSHSNFRQDVVYRRLNEYVLSQEWKQILEVKQRRDRKLRQTNLKKKK